MCEYFFRLKTTLLLAALLYSLIGAPAQADSFAKLRCYYRTPTQEAPESMSYVLAQQPDSRDVVQIPGRWWSDRVYGWRNLFFTPLKRSALEALCRDTLDGLSGHPALAEVTIAPGIHSIDYAFWSETPHPRGNDSPHIERVIVFGDSLSDNGNIFNASDWHLPNPASWAHGHFSNGPIWAEYLVQAYHLDFNDWGIGGMSSVGEYKLPGLNEEVSSYLAYVKDLRDYRPENTLFMLLMGANDVMHEWQGVDRLIAPQQTALQALMANGARNVLVSNLPDISRAPAYLGTQQADVMHQRVLEYNQRLPQLLTQLRQQYPDANIALFDLFDDFNEILEHPQHYGFSNIQQPCLDLSSQSLVTFLTAHPMRPSCDPDRYAFWDMVHPTTRLHATIATMLYSFVNQHFRLRPQQNGKRFDTRY